MSDLYLNIYIVYSGCHRSINPSVSNFANNNNNNTASVMIEFGSTCIFDQALTLLKLINHYV